MSFLGAPLLLEPIDDANEADEEEAERRPLVADDVVDAPPFDGRKKNFQMSWMILKYQ